MLTGKEVVFTKKELKEIDSCGYTPVSGWEDVPTIYYDSGISNIDSLLAGNSFAKTRLLHDISFSDDAMIFSFEYGRLKLNMVFNKSEIKGIFKNEDQKIEIRRISEARKFIGMAKTGIPFIGIPSIIAREVKTQLASTKAEWSKHGKTKLVKGTMYEIIILDDEGNENAIKVYCENEDRSKVNRFFDKHLNLGLSKDDPDSNCFIATVCYGDPLAREVIEFRKFRDGYLVNSKIGNTLVNIYYKTSPKIAEFLRSHTKVKKLVKLLVLDTLYKLIRKRVAQ